MYISGLGDRWGPFILDFYPETFVLEFGVSQACHFYWIGGSTNVTSPDPCCIRREDQIINITDYIPNDSGTSIRKTLFQYLFIF